ncbi:MAG TPA: CHASE2 domain-containing protein [Kiloniellaceae bacterium]|nr:CHASE2 domain-containing protein [Kiloniellaceae bacterium]
MAALERALLGARSGTRRFDSSRCGPAACTSDPFSSRPMPTAVALRRWTLRAAFWVGLAVVVLLRFADPDPFPTLRYASFDVAQSVFAGTAEPQRLPLAVVDIDERSLAQQGQWPWPRDIVADLVGRIAASKPLVLGIDIIFAEPDRLSPESLLKRFPLDAPLRESLSALPSNDAILAAKLRTLPTVLAVAAIDDGEAPVGQSGMQAPIRLRLGQQSVSELRRYPGLLRNLPVLEEASSGVGVASLELSGDGVVRKMPAVMLVGDAVLPSFALEVLRIARGGDAVSVEINGPGVAAVSLADTEIPTTYSGHVWLRDRPSDRFLRISAADLMSGAVPLASLQGHIVLLGSTGVGLGREFVTPSGSLRSDVDVQALFLENLMTESFLVRPQAAALWEALLALAVLSLAVLAVPRLSGYSSLLAMLGLLSLLFAGSLFAMRGAGVLLDPTYTAVVGSIAYLVVLGRGLAEAQQQRRRSAEEREMALILAEAGNRSKTSFFANMSHELRTPLNAILGFSEMMKREILGPISPPKYRDYVEDIHHMGNHLLSLVNDILEMSKVEAGESHLSESEFPLQDVLADCVRTVQSAYRDSGIAVSFGRETVAHRLWADKRMFTQMVLNLVSNAVKYTPKGGEVRLTGSVDERGDFRLSISDTGIGMSDKEVSEAFVPFRRIDHALASNLEGIGLGLPLTKAMIEMHGGRLELTSVTDRGTTATLVFPASRLRNSPDPKGEEATRFEESA